jgi:ribonuclease P protein component
MLPKSERFTKEDFQGKRPKVFFRSELFDVAALTLPSQKFACVTAKKTLKRAVDRNLIKRRIFSAIQEISPISTYSLVFYPKKGSVTVPFKQLHDEIKKAFDTLH